MAGRGLTFVFRQEFTVEDLGVSIGLSYHDPSRKVRGGKLHFDSPKVGTPSLIFSQSRDRDFIGRQTLSWILTETEELLQRKKILKLTKTKGNINKLLTGMAPSVLMWSIRSMRVERPGSSR